VRCATNYFSHNVTQLLGGNSSRASEIGVTNDFGIGEFIILAEYGKHLAELVDDGNTATGPRVRPTSLLRRT
jgi:hypothetical protein